MFYITFVINLILCLSYYHVYGYSCITPNEKEGRCVSIYDCPKLLELLQRPLLWPEEATYAKMAKCTNGEGRFPFVCCETKEIKLSDNFLLFDGEKSECGLDAEDKILGGKATGLDEFPWFAVLEYENETGHRKPGGCGGSLINSKYVLTAAHCNVGKLVGVRLGEYNLNADPDCVGNENSFDRYCSDSPQNINIESIILHPGYNSENMLHDIAILKLAQNATFSPFVQPICLPSGNFTSSKTNKTVMVTGFGSTLKGKTSIKQKLDLKIFDHENCKKKFGEKRNITENQICAGGEYAKDACQGDSGGPLMQWVRYWTLEGVTSYGFGCGREGWPGIYTNVHSYMPWILENLVN